MRVLATSLFVAVLGLTGCSSSPSKADGRAVFEDQISSTLDYGSVSIDDFRKVNGQEAEQRGVKIYILEYEVDIECRESADPGKVMGYCKGKDPGEVVSTGGSLAFEKTDRVWRGQNGEIY